MARKKKSAQKSRDARGYSQGTPTAQSKRKQQSSASSTVAGSNAPSVSTKTHEEMKDLLGQFGGNAALEEKGTASSSSTVRPSDRFASRFANVVDRLDDLGFANVQVERVVKSLRYEITLETALDWLCLNLTTLELPSLFTDGDLRKDLSTVTTAESLTVLQESAPANTEHVVVDSHAANILAVDQKLTSDGGFDETGNKEDESAKTKEEEERKQWLLQQYEYEEDEDGGVDGGKPLETAPREAAANESLTPEQQLLAEERKSLAELEADLNNDANNYTRSKAEIKQLKIQAGKMRQKVAALRKKVERDKARQRREEKDRQATVDASGKRQKEKGREETADASGQRQEEKGREETADVSAHAVKEEEEEAAENYGGGIFDTVAKVENEEKKDTAEEETPTEAPKLPDYRIPGSWTGSTPQKKLEELLKRQKLPRAKYNKLPMNGGFILAVTLNKKKEPPLKWEARAVEFVKGSSLRDYLATHAVYAIEPNLPLHRVFPQPFRELWLSWVNQKKEDTNQAQKVQDDAKQLRMDRLTSLLITDTHGTDRTDGATKNNNSRGIQKNTGSDNHDYDDTVIDHWDDDSVEDAPVYTRPTFSTKGKQMQTDFYRRQSTRSYQKMKSVRDSLPMASFRSDVLETVERNPVTILCAETGAGKSTQCAQYILERALLDGRGDAVNILCTQPRRVAATTLAERVADEMCEDLGKMVGYQIRNESKRSSRTRLLFCTTGVVLRRLQDDPALVGVTHVICDEVHERSQQIDVLLIILRQLLGTTRPDLKVILMSATMETDLFRSFFQGAPMISVPGRTFPVSSYYLEDLLDATYHIIEEGSRYAFRENHYGETASLWVSTRGGEKRKETVDLSSQVESGGVSDMYAGYTMSTRRSMDRVNEGIINYDLIEDVLKLITNAKDGNDTLVAPDGADMSKGSILIFLPGLGEIKALTERLDGSRLFRDRQRFDLIPLHSTLSSGDQRRAFLPSKPGCRKIICATNIAETSVTIPDVVYVIDTGRMREVRRNKRTSTSMLVTDWCPQSSAKQRQGRAGRVQSGVCLKLYSSRTAEIVMKVTNEPELRRVPLEEICMSILASGFAKSCMDFLDQAPQPPAKESVQAAMNVLYDVGAIERIGTDSLQQSEYLTPLGFHLAKLPVDVKLGKMLIFGALFRCIDPIITIAACLSSKSPFSASFNDAATAKAKQRVFSDPDSDFMTYCNVWDAYEASSSASRRFCQENYLNRVALREIGDARQQFLDLLCGIGFLDRNIVMGNRSRIDPKRLKASHFNRHAKKTDVIHAVMCAGLYPNVLRLEQSASLNYSMWHKEERIHFHSASVNAAKKRFLSSENWVLFHEKFGTPNRTSVSTTAFVHPFALLLFGGSVLVKHTERMVIVDEWMSIGMSAQTGVILRELRKKVDIFLQRMIKCVNTSEIEQLDSSTIDGIIKILAS